MRSPTLLLASLLSLPACSGSASTPARAEPAAKAEAKAPAKADREVATDLSGRAEALAHKYIILDGHVDVPYRLHSSRGPDGNLTENISEATEEGNFDFPRAKKGGLDAPFMSIYIPSKHEKVGDAKQVADQLIDMVEGFENSWPDKFVVARSVADVLQAKKDGKIALPMGMENGAPLEGKLENVAHFHERGIRYITLTHSKNNHISDSSFDDEKQHEGLSDFGKKVVAEMNRIGIMIDVSHVSDDAFWQVMELTKTPVIASHSSARHFTPGWQRNMADDMIEALAKNGGVIQINFGSSFIDDAARKARGKHWEEIDAILAEKKLTFGEPEAKKIVDEYQKTHKAKYATVEQVADHIDHVVKLVGVDHVGLGSDFDGVGDSLPTGLKDVSQYPNLIRVLLERGYKPADIEKICSGNVLRVWRAVEDHAASAAG